MPENTKQNLTAKSGYAAALKLAKQHYENFPVISFLIPKNLRKHIAVFYWFARTADDMADEGTISEEERINQLEDFEDKFSFALEGSADDSVLAALVQTINEKNLTKKYFYDLLKAFKQDVTKKRYQSFEEVLNYCKHSANPVGRIILEIFNIRNEEANNYSDKICTALQLTNFYQDTKTDFDKGRIYYPVNELEKFNVTENMFAANTAPENLKHLLKYNIERTEALFAEGSRLLSFLDGRLKLEIGWTINGGIAILKKIRKINFDILAERPVLTKFDFIRILLKSFF